MGFTTGFTNPFTRKFGQGLYNNRRKNQFELTDAQRETLPYVQAEKLYQEKENQRFKPLEMILDLLQRGQYVTANLGEDVTKILDYYLGNSGNTKHKYATLLDKAMGREGLNPYVSILQGLSGKRKGTWKKTFFGGQDEGDPENFKGIWQTISGDEQLPDWLNYTVDVPIIGPTGAQDLIGLLGDIFLDPLTYVSSGATKGASKGATEFSEQVLKQTLKRTGNIDEIAKFAKKTFSKIDFDKILSKKGAKDAFDYIAKHAAKHDVARWANKILKQAYREGLEMTPELLQKTFLKNLKGDEARFIKQTAEKLAKDKGSKATVRDFIDRLSRSGQYGPIHRKHANPLDDLIARANKSKLGKKEKQSLFEDMMKLMSEQPFKGITDPLKKTDPFSRVVGHLDEYAQKVAEVGGDRWLAKWEGMGEVGLSFFGVPIWRKPRNESLIAKSWDKFRDNLLGSKIGTKLGDAVWSVMNRGPIGTLRRMFGISNPYQKVLRIIGADNVYENRFMRDAILHTASEIFGEADDETVNGAFRILMEADNAQALTDDVIKLAGVPDAKLDQAKKMVDDIRGIFKRWGEEEQELVEEGLMKAFSLREYYLPNYGQHKMNIFKKSHALGTAPSYTHHRTREWEEVARGEMEKFKLILGVDDNLAKHMAFDLNWSTTNMDLKEIFIHRGFAHAQSMTNANLIRQYRQYGIQFGFSGPQATMSKIDFFGDLDPVEVNRNYDLLSFLKSRGAGIPELGVRQVNHPAFEGYMFDNELADIIERTMALTSDKGMTAAQQRLRAFSGWWRGIATLSPGFHFRNARSNTFTAFMKHGMKGLDPKRHYRAFVGTCYTLYGDEMFSKFKIPQKHAQKILEEVVGTMDVDLAKKLGMNLDGVMGDFIEITRKDLADIARYRGIVSKASKGYDLENAMEQIKKMKKWYEKLNLFKNENLAFEASREAGAIIESTPKLMSFELDLLDMMQESGNITEYMVKGAVFETKKWFFDYEDLSEFEQKIMKNIIPFYTWLRKNIALQVTQMFESKAAYSTMAKLRSFMTDEDVDRESMPEYMREGGYLPVASEDTNTGFLVNLFPKMEGLTRVRNPNLPYADINKIPFSFEFNELGIPIPRWDPKNTMDDLLSSINPIIKTFAEIIPENGAYDIFRKRDLGPQAVAPRALRLLALNKNILPFLDNVIKKMGFKDGLDVGKDSNGRMIINSDIQRILENNFIILERFDQLGDTLTTIIPKLEDAIYDATGYKNKYEGLDKIFRIFSFWFGIKQKDIDLDQEQLYRYREILKAAEEQRRRDKRKLPGYSSYSEEYKKKELERMRKLGLRF